MLRFNFAEVKEPVYSKFLKPDLLFSLLVFSLVLIGSYFYASSIESGIKATQRRIDLLKEEMKRLGQVKRKEKELITKKRKLEKRLKAISLLERGRRVPPFLYFFSSPENVKGVWLDSLSYAGGTLTLSGGTLKVENLPEFVGKVNGRLGKILFRSVQREVYENGELGLRIPYYKFSFVVELRVGTAR